MPNLELEKQLIASSGLFEESVYLGEAGAGARSNPIDHYLRVGWRLGLQPNLTFPGNLLQPYFASIGYDQAPAITWLTLRAAGWPLPATRAELVQLGIGLDGTEFFDEAFYIRNSGLMWTTDLIPAVHYEMLGERLGLAPSAHFDPSYYATCYPDVVQAGISCLRHFVVHGRLEGRSPHAPRLGRPGQVVVDSNKENVILVLHEASRTGAPILGWNVARFLAQKYNLHTVLLGSGDLTKEFEDLSVEVHGPFIGKNRYSPAVQHSIEVLTRSLKFRYAIVNSAESRDAIEPIVRNYVPAVFLMHEFGSYVNPTHSLRTSLDWSTEIVFPARIVAESAREAHPILAARHANILPQGESLVPAAAPLENDKSSSVLERLIRRKAAEQIFIVLGAGSVQIRKGVDLFLAAASKIARTDSAPKIHFLWVGQGFAPKEDMAYSVYLYEQLKRSDLSEHVTFLDAVPDLEPIYQIADVFLLASRLDPFPNVSIDAAVRGIPIVCFRNASGAADFMLSNPETAQGVVDYHDAEGVADVILALATDKERWRRMAAATREVARSNFDMNRYVAKLDELGTGAAQRMTRRATDADTLLADATFNQNMFLGPSSVMESRAATISRYLALAAARGWGTLPVADTALRRPCPGFNPAIYVAQHGVEVRPETDPLADFIRRGKPAGDWQSVVLEPNDSPQIRPDSPLRVALHAHFFYPELAADFLAHLAPNRTPCDLFVSTDKETKAEELERALAAHTSGPVTVRVFPNCGRDIAPLLTGFAEDLSVYDLIGHVHAKRSLFSDDRILGDTWREFLWQNLLGGQHAMMDRIVAAFEQQQRLGLVFPSDPHLIGWDDNRPHAEAIAAHMGWLKPLPEAFDFPLGTMFWMRTNALRPLFDLGFAWADYPSEPLAYDGTLLHAIERLVPFASQLAGFSQAVTHVSGISW